MLKINYMLKDGKGGKFSISCISTVWYVHITA
jgi:hypothetical protein